MMKMGVWYETALCQSNNGRKNIFANNVDMPFKHGKYFRCVIPVFTELTGKYFFLLQGGVSSHGFGLSVNMSICVRSTTQYYIA